MRALAILVVLAGVARADAGAQLDYEASTYYRTAQDHMAAPGALLLVGARLHGFAGAGAVGYHGGVDAAVGATLNGDGFAYDVVLFPYGVGIGLGGTSHVELGVGVGANGATSSLDDAVSLPAEIRFELGSSIRLLGRVRTTKLFASKSRQIGVYSDELEATFAVRLAHASGEGYRSSGNFIGAGYRELMGERFFGIIIGFAQEIGTPYASYHERARHDDGEGPDID